MRRRTRRRAAFATAAAILAALAYNCAGGSTGSPAASRPYAAATGTAAATDPEACKQDGVAAFLDGVERHARRGFAPGRAALPWLDSLDAAAGSGAPYVGVLIENARTAAREFRETSGPRSARLYRARQVHLAAATLVQACGLDGRYRFDERDVRLRAVAAKPRRSGRPLPDVGDSDSSSGSGSSCRRRGWFRAC
ncbi:hypothetical protein [Nonomuraea sp. SBT364]|uniref:hypothetical protein n=1 Tax=Nonomuraea sp. SBT364 TaxID=1580530 RepID=UPI00066C076C|nr:hypothetical protein [Nonomuraea sp. SBT364]